MKSLLVGLFIVGMLATETENTSTEALSIPLSKVLTTGPQKGMLQPNDAFLRGDGGREYQIRTAYLRQIENEANGGASNVFLVDAPNMQDAVRATTGVVIGSRSARTPAPVNTPTPARGNYWLVVYLGSGPSFPVWWTVEDIEVQGKNMKVSYRESPPRGATRDRRPYFFWIPIGKLEVGDYELELFDVGRKATSLLRRVEVQDFTSDSSKLKPKGE